MQIGARQCKKPRVVPVAVLASLVAINFIALKHLRLGPGVAMAAGVDYCYSDIGCFPLSDEFYHPRHRPINVRPLHRRHIKTQFELFNRDHPEGFIMLPWDRYNLLQSGFNPNLETKIIIPGWLDNINRALWVRKMKDALLWLWTPVNIIVVRWTNFTPYTIATANTRVVGAELANLMKFLEHEIQYDPAFYHIIGHSLGAHIGGYCGDRVPGLGRITALDPARPFFQHMPKSVRLDRGDAKFVDAIHSDFTPENAIFLLMSYGMTTPVGHLDFYPNGPPLFQPGCMRDTLLSVQTGIAKGLQSNSLSVAFLESIRYLTACDHQRSHEWFIESITNRECAFVGVRCNEFEGMINGRCTCDDSPSACAIMGINADQMYLNNVHEELWPIRAGSINYRYKSIRRPGPPLPSAPAAVALRQLHRQQQQKQMLLMMEMMQEAGGAPAQQLGQPLDLDYLTDSLEENYHLLAKSAAGGAQMPHLTKDEVYARLKQEAEQAHAAAGEPKLAAATSPTALDEQQRQQLADLEDQQVAASEQAGSAQVPTEDGDEQFLLSQQSQLALEDLAFVEYLRSQLLTSEAGDQTQRRNESSSVSSTGATAQAELTPQANLNTTAAAAANETASAMASETISKRAWPHDYDQPTYTGHPALLSSMKRDIESWYEDNARWHLKTNNQPAYCSNQYQLLVYLGPLKTANGRDRLRANLVVSIIGTRGQLLNQRFIPRGSTLSSFTMQPFFILLEGSYSLGQIKSVALAWEARTDPDPVQATVTFQSSLVEQMGQRVPAYKAKQFPWMPEETEYDYTSGFSQRMPIRQASPPVTHTVPLYVHRLGSDPPRLSHLYRRPVAVPLAAELLRANIAGHYSRLYSSSSSSPHLEKRADGTAWASSRPAHPDSPGAGCSRSRRHSQTPKHVECNQSARLRVRRAAAANQPGRVGRRADDPDESVTSPNAVQDEAKLEAQEAEHVEHLLELKRAQQEEEMLRTSLALQQQQQQQQQQLLVAAAAAAAQAPNQTYAVPPQAAPTPLHTVGAFDQVEQDMSLSSSESYFVPVVDPPEEPSVYAPKPGSQLPPEALEDHEGEVTLDLHNVDLQHDAGTEDSIVINQVVVSPLQATYGRYGRSAKTFCPPAALRRRMLLRDQSIQLAPTFMLKCHHYQMNSNRLVVPHAFG